MGHGQIVDLLLSRGASVEEQSLTLGSPLHAACHQGDLLTLDRLLESFAAVRSERQVRDGFGEDLRSAEDMPPKLSAHRAEPIHVAAVAGNIGVIDRLVVQYGANIDAICSGWRVGPQLSARVDPRNDLPLYAGRTALMCAVCEAQNDVVARLLQLHAQTDFQDSKGLTALALAAQSNNADAAYKLLSANASTTLPDKDHRSPVDHAISHGSIDCLRALLLGQARLSTDAIELAVSAGHADIVRFLAMERGITVAAYQPSLLHLAAKLGHAQVAQVLVTSGIKVDVQDEDGNTPLHYAAYYNRANVAKTLIRNQADVWKENSHKGRLPITGHRTVFDLATGAASEGTRIPFGNPAEVAQQQANHELAVICRVPGSRTKKRRADLRRKGELAAAFGCFCCAPCYVVKKLANVK